MDTVIDCNPSEHGSIICGKDRMELHQFAGEAGIA